MTAPDPRLITLHRTGQRDLSFVGHLLASVETQGRNQAHARYSGETGHGYGVWVHATTGGKYVIAVEHTSQWSGDAPVTHDATIVDSLDDVAAWIESDSPLPAWAKSELLAALGVPPESVA